MKKPFKRQPTDFKPDTPGVVHFHSSEPAFCGSKQQHRQFTFDHKNVTCPACAKKWNELLPDDAK